MNTSKSSFNESFLESRHYDMPLRYQHIRCGERQVKPDYYLLMHVLKSKYHMSENMAQGAIIEVANYFFGQKEHGKWKPMIATLCRHHLTPRRQSRILKSWYFQILWKK